MDENGKRFLTRTFDQYGRATKTVQGTNSHLTNISYDDATGNRTVTNGLGEVNTYVFAVLNGNKKLVSITRSTTTTAPAATQNFTYDTSGFLASKTDWNGNLTTYTSDALGRVTTLVEAVGTPLSRTTSTLYLGTTDLPIRVIAPQLKTNLEYDAYGSLITQTLTDTSTNALPYSTNGQVRITRFTWDKGLLTSIQSARTDLLSKTTFAYDSSGALVSSTDPLGHVEQVSQHSPCGYPLQSIDANGIPTQFTYDARQRLTSFSIGASAPYRTTQFRYDGTGKLIQIINPGGGTSNYVFDSAHRLVEILDPKSQKIVYSLDGEGNRTLMRLTDNLEQAKYQIETTYDLFGRPIVQYGGLQVKKSFGYDSNGNLTATIDGSGRAATNTFDALNRRIKNSDFLSAVTSFSYDKLDRPLSVKAANGSLTTYTYNGFGNITKVSSADSQTTTFFYDEEGNVTKKIDASGVTENLAYDALGRVISKQYPGSPGENMTFSYDELGHGFGTGHLTSILDRAGLLSFYYNQFGNITRELRQKDSLNLATLYGYDLDGRILDITYPSGLVVHYVRDAAGQITSVTARPNGSAVFQKVAQGITYMPFGPMTTLTFANGIRETRRFDESYRATTLVSTGTSLVQSFLYAYDYEGNVKKVNDKVDPSQSQVLSYDVMNRLTNAAGGYGSQTFTYDLIGNRLTQKNGSTLTGYTYQPNSNRLATISVGASVQNVGYSATGNIASLGGTPTTSMTYSQSGQLSEVKSGAQSLGLYTYDGLGRFTEKTTSTSHTFFEYDLQGRRLEETSATGTGIIDYIYLDDGRLIATYSPSTNALSFIHTDRLGVPTLATNNVQAPVWAAVNDPFGAVSTTGTAVQNLRLPGQYADEVTGWSQNGFRTYVPALGRYLESDPIGIGGGTNTYIYGLANPFRYLDPSGLATKNEGISEWDLAEGMATFYETQFDVAAKIAKNTPYAKTFDRLSRLSGLVGSGTRAAENLSQECPNEDFGQVTGQFLGDQIGSAVGRTIGAATGPFAIVASPVLGIVGGYLGGWLGGYLGSQVGHYFHDGGYQRDIWNVSGWLAPNG